LDTGVHPHGDKWWRFRYERAYVESMMMIFICTLMLIVDQAVRVLRQHIYSLTDHDLVANNTRGTMYVKWLEGFGHELMTSLIVYLLLWTMSQTGVFEFCPGLLRGSAGLHTPSTGEEYRRLAVEICVVLFFTILFYYFIVYSIARSCTNSLVAWDKPEHDPGRHKFNYDDMHAYLISSVEDLEPVSRERLMKALGPAGVENFNLREYITLATTHCCYHMIMFGGLIWALIIVTFVGFMILHGFLHISYIRIALVYAIVTGIMFVPIARAIRKIQDNLMPVEGNRRKLAKASWIHSALPTELIICTMLHYCLFFLCYFAARMVCQPWMWELHFWPVCILTCCVLCIAVCFYVLVAPAVPIYAACTALPPYVDNVNLDIMRLIADAEKEGKQVGTGIRLKTRFDSFHQAA